MKTVQDDRPAIMKEHGLLRADTTLRNTFTLRDYDFLADFINKVTIPHLAAMSSRAYTYFQALGKADDSKYKPYDVLHIFKALKEMANELSDFDEEGTTSLMRHDMSCAINLNAFIAFVEANGYIDGILFELETAADQMSRRFTPETVINGTEILLFIDQLHGCLGNIQANRRVD